MKCAFLVPFFGAIPPYFPFWAKSCEANQDHFYWYVYSDQIRTKQKVNSAVMLIPYDFSEMAADFKHYLHIHIKGYFIRKLCEYRIMFYFLRKDREGLEQFDFIGYTDMDMIYGRLFQFLPNDMNQYSLIGADDHAPCGPFTLINRHCIQQLAESEIVKNVMSSSSFHVLDESPQLLEIMSKCKPVFCRADPIQPTMTKHFNKRKTFAIWNNGSVTVWDIKGNRKEGGFYHFSRYKGKKRFNINESLLKSSRWGICKFGFVNLISPKGYLPLIGSLLV